MSNPLPFAAKSPSTERLRLNRRQTTMESPYSLATQTISTASEWVLEWTWPGMRITEAVRVNAWLASLDGTIGTFRYYVRQPYNTSGLTNHGLAVVGYQYGRSILVGGWSANAPSQLFAGQYFTIGEQLLMITSASSSADAQGRVAISFDPWLRLNYLIGTAVNFTAPFGIFRLGSSEGHTYTLTPDRVADFGTIGAREVVS